MRCIVWHGVCLYIDEKMNYMSYKKTIIPLILAYGCSLTGYSSVNDTLSLKQCMEYALSKSTKLKIQKADIDDKRLAIRDAVLSAFTPSISASAYAYYNFGRSIDPQTNTYFNQTSFHNNYSIGASIDLFDGFSAVNNIKISKTGLMISKSEEKQAEADICLSIMEAYYNVVFYKRLGEVYKLQIEEATNALRKAKIQEELGQTGYSEVVQLEADLADREYDYANNQVMLADQEMTLRALMFWDEPNPLEISTELPIYRTINPDAESLISKALEYNPEIKIAELTVVNSKRELTVAKWALFPTFTLYGGWNTSYYTYSGATTPKFGEQFRNNRGEYLELAVSIPIYDRLKGHSNIKRKKNAYLKAKTELDQKRMDVEMEIRRAVSDCESTSAAYKQAMKKSLVQEEAYRLNLKKLEQGLISSLEFQTANDNYLKAKADEMNSLFKLIIKQSVIRYYSGIEYINQNY